MKIQGKDFAAKAKPFTVSMANGEEVVLIVSPLPPGFIEEEEEEVPQPRMPYRVARQPKTGRILRDGDGNSVTVPDENDPKYQRKVLRCAQARAARVVATALRDSPGIEFDTQRGDYPRMENYFYELGAEMISAGLAQAQQSEIIRTVLDISGMNLRDAQEVAEATFPDGEEPRPAVGREAFGEEG